MAGAGQSPAGEDKLNTGTNVSYGSVKTMNLNYKYPFIFKEGFGETRFYKKRGFPKSLESWRNYMQSVITNSGRAALAKAILERPLHLAWGIGEEAWDTDPSMRPVLVSATNLTHEIGRRKVTIKGFVEPSETGDITIPYGADTEGNVQESRFQRVEYPTPYLYIQVKFAFGDASSATIREAAVFTDTVTKSALPLGQEYFVPADVEDTGMMFAAYFIDPPIKRSTSIRQVSEFVIQI